jgi:hypothetical protein
MTTPQLTGWIKGRPLRSRPGPYEVAIEMRGELLAARDRWHWTGCRWKSEEVVLTWTHFRGLAKKA